MNRIYNIRLTKDEIEALINILFKTEVGNQITDELREKLAYAFIDEMQRDYQRWNIKNIYRRLSLSVSRLLR